MKKTIVSVAAVAILILLTEAAVADTAVGTILTDCDHCPAMVVIPPGSFKMGSDRIEPMKGGEMRPQGPIRSVTIPKRIAVGRYAVTNAEYGAFVAATGRPAQSCRAWAGEAEASGFNWRNPQEGHLARDDEPVVCVYWNDAAAYAAWLAEETGKPYRLPSEAEWEYAANGGSAATWPWGEDAGDVCEYGNVLDRDGVNNPRILKGATTTKPTMAAGCSDGHAGVAPVGQYKPNGFGLYDMVGNVWEWVQDCSLKYYPASPVDGTAVEVDGPCEKRAIRGGSWRSRLIRQRTTFRGRDPEPTSYHLFGFRVARDIE